MDEEKVSVVRAGATRQDLLVLSGQLAKDGAGIRRPAAENASPAHRLQCAFTHVQLNYFWARSKRRSKILIKVAIGNVEKDQKVFQEYK